MKAHLLKIKQLRLIANSIKLHSDIFTVIGFVFFLTVFLISLIWILSDLQVEPVFATMSVLSTVFFGLPRGAEWLLPERKAIRHMSYDEIISFIVKSDYKQDWNNLPRQGIDERILREDPRLRLRIEYNDFGTHNEDFYDVWLEKCQAQKISVKSYWCDIYYGNSLLERVVLVSVDKGKCFLPTPNDDHHSVNNLDYFCAKIFDQMDNFDKYFKKSEFVVT